MKTKLLLMLFVVGLAAGVAQANMLLNPSFEEGAFEHAYTPDEWTHWYTAYEPMHTWISNADEAHWGSKYMKMNMWSWSYTGWLLQTVNVTPDQEYAFSVWAKCPDIGETSEAWGYYEWLNSTGGTISEGWLPLEWDVGGNWAHVEFGTITAPASATEVIYYLATRIENSLMGILYDDAGMNTPVPSFPTPAWEAKVAIGDVELRWTNLAPKDVNDVYVDVLFGTDLISDYTKIVDAIEDANSVTVKGLDAGAYYWRVDSYIYGDPATTSYETNPGDPNIIRGYAWSFDVVADAPPSSLDAGVDMITWEGEPVQLDGTVVDDGESALTIAWSSDDPAGTNVLFSNPNIEDPTVTITKGPYDAAGIINPSFEEFLIGWDIYVEDGWCGVWDGTFGKREFITPSDGDYCVWLHGNYGDGVIGSWISQTLVETLATDTTYTLEVDVIKDGYYTEDVHYMVQLLAGETVVAEDDDSLALDPIPPGNSSDWETSTVVFTVGDPGPSDPNFVYVGKPLGIRLVAKLGTQEMSFDNVRLTANPPFPAPEFSSVELTLRASDDANPTYVQKDSMTVDVYETACAAAIGAGLRADNPGDFDGNCITGLEDLAEMVSTWLNDTGLTEAVSLTVNLMARSANIDLIDGLVEYWRLDGDYSAEVTESHVGTLTTSGTGSGTFVSGKFGQGIDLENSAGNQAYIVIGGDENDFDFAGESMSISLWYTTESLYTAWQCLAAKGEGSSWRLHRNSNSTYGNTETDINFHTSINVTGYGALDQQDGSWHHVVATADAVNGGNLYVDGSLVDSVSGSIAIAGNDAAMQIAGNPGAGGRGWDGLLDDVGIWNRALTADEVSWIWNGGAGISIGNITGISPYDGETVSAGLVDLSWKNPPPNDPNDSVWVDVWFGTDPISDYEKVVDAGENVTTVQVNAPVIGGTYYWQVNSYLDGSPTGDPNEGDVWTFYASNLPPYVEAGDDMITWSGEAATMDATVEDDELSGPLSYSWSADPNSMNDTNLTITITDAYQEDATVEITKTNPTGDATVVTMTLEVDDVFNPPVEDTMTIDVYDNNCLAAKAAGLADIDAGDFDADCKTNLEDYAEMALTWLVDYTLTEPAEKP